MILHCKAILGQLQPGLMRGIFGLNHTPGAGSNARPVGQRSSTLPLYHGCLRIADELMPKSDCEIGLLIGYDCPRVFLPREVITVPDQEVFAQRIDLGWG